MEEVSTEKSADTKPRVSLLVRLRRWAFFIAFQFILVFLLLELAARFVDPLGISYYPETAQLLDSLMIKEEPIGYRCKPNVSQRHYAVPVTTNSYGLRDREFPLEPAQDEFRILVMGDSFIFGVGVSYEDSIPHQLEVIANEKSSGNRRYRTINMGVPSYNTEQEKIQLETLGLKFQPDLVMLLFISNDIEPKMWVFDKRASLAANFSQRSYALSTLFVLKNKIASQMKKETPTTQKSPTINRPRYQPSHPRWLSIDQSLTEINQLCKKAEVPFVLFVPLADSHPAVAMLSEVGKREGFEIFRLRPFEDPRWKEENKFDYRNSVVDSHPNSKGCQMHAEIIHDMLSQANLLD